MLSRVVRSPLTSAPDLGAPWRVATTTFFALVLVAPWHAGVAALGFAGAAIVAVVRRDRIRPASPSPASSAFVVVTLAVAASALLPAVLHPLDGNGPKLLAQFLLLPAIAILCSRLADFAGVGAAVWTGATVGAVGAAITAVAQVVVLDLTRAEGAEGNAIVFGAVALVLGALSATLVGPARTWWASRSADAAPVVGRIAWVGATSGLVACALSGSRGAWLAAIPIGVLLVSQHATTLSRTTPRQLRRCLAPGLVALLVVGGSVVASGGMPTRRLVEGVTDVSGYADASTAESAGTTVGARFEAWRAAAVAATDHPIIGIGWGNLQSHFVEQVAVAGRHERIAEFTHAHQQLLGVWASSGLIGVVAFGALVIVPGRYFRRARRSDDEDTRAIGTAGLVVIVGYVAFGLTEAIFESVVALVVYAITVGLLSSHLRPDAPPSLASATGRYGSADVRCERVVVDGERRDRAEREGFEPPDP